MLVITLSIVILFLLDFTLNYIPHPKGFVENMTFETYSNILYDYEIVKYPSGAEVHPVEADQERIGVGVITDDWNLKFGSMPIGGTSSRYIDLVNLGEKKVKVVFRSYGNITPFVDFSKNNFVLDPKDNATIKVSFNSRSGGSGNYTGDIYRIVKIPKYNFIYIFW